MTKLIVNADDFGLSEAVNYGIISAYKNGIVRSTTIMAGMPAFDLAVELLKENKGLGCGVHMTLSLNEPVLNYHKTIVDENGNFYRRITNELIEEKFDLDEVYEEFCSQINKVINSGVNVDHLDSHHHVHLLNSNIDVALKLAHEYDLPIRQETYLQKDFEPVYFEELFYNQDATFEMIDTILHKDVKNYELMCHPAMIDWKLYQISSYNLRRAHELDIICSQKAKEMTKKIELINYQDIEKI